MARPGLRLLALLAACALGAFAEDHPGWDVSTLPSPGTHPASCGRAHVEHSWLCDPDKLLSAEGGDAVEAVLAALHRAAPARAAAPAAAGAQQAPAYPHATCDGKPSRGYEARVACAIRFCAAAPTRVASPRGALARLKCTALTRHAQVAVAVMRRAGGRGSREDRTERLAKGLHDAWGVGDACGSGLLLLVAVDDRQVRAMPLVRARTADTRCAHRLCSRSCCP